MPLNRYRAVNLLHVCAHGSNNSSSSQFHKPNVSSFIGARSSNLSAMELACVCRAQVRVLEQRNLLSVLTVCVWIYIFFMKMIFLLSLAHSPMLAFRHRFVPSADFFWLMVIERCGLTERIQYQYLCMNIYTIMTDTGVYGLLARLFCAVYPKNKQFADCT